MGERLLCKQEAVGSIPSGSTNQGTGNGKSRGKPGGFPLVFWAGSYRLFFNNVEEVKGLALTGGSWRELGRAWRGETGLDCIDPFIL